jgi:dienelactone hydrolase
MSFIRQACHSFGRGSVMVPKRSQVLLVFLLVFIPVIPCESGPAIVPQTVEIPCDGLRLKAFLWKPAGRGPFPAVLFNHGSGDIDANHTAGMPITEAAEELAPQFLAHGYAFLYLFRRGQGLSADQAPFIQDRLRNEEAAHGRDARDQLQLRLLTTEQLDDVMAALQFMKSMAEIDAHRIAIAGHSFGGQLTLLAAQRASTVRAVVTFGAAANSWQRSLQLRDLLLTAVAETHAPIMLIHASNDYSSAPGRALAEKREQLHKPVVLMIYPPIGQTADDGHNMVYGAVVQWERNVFEFLNANVKR